MTGSHWHNESCAGIITPGHINSLWTGASVVTISAQQLRSLIVTFPNRQPLTAVAIQERLDGGWSDEQAHLDGWLAEYDDPGYYNRAGHNYDAKYFYNHFQDGYGLMWLAEAVGVDRSVLEQGASAMWGCFKEAATKRKVRSFTSQTGKRLMTRSYSFCASPRASREYTSKDWRELCPL